MKSIALSILLGLTTLNAGEISIAVAANVSYAMEALKKEFNRAYPQTQVQIIVGMIDDGDRVVIDKNVELSVKQVGRNLLLRDLANGLRTTLESMHRDQLLDYQPELLG